MAKDVTTSTAKRNTLDLKQQASSMNAVGNKLADFRALLASRQAAYVKMSPAARQAWRASASDPVMAEAVAMFAALKTLFGKDLEQ